MIGVTYKQLNIFKQVAVLFLKYSERSKNTKLYFAVNKINKKTDKHQEDYADRQGDINREDAMTDKDKKLLINQFGQYEYTKEGADKRQKKLRELNNEVVEIEPHIVNDPHENLGFEYTGADGQTYEITDYEVRSAFEGFVINPDDEIEV